MWRCLRRAGNARGAGTIPAVEVRDLHKRHPKGAVNAVDGVSFAVTPGEVSGLPGPHRAGKTTTVGISVVVLAAFTVIGIRLFLRRAMD